MWRCYEPAFFGGEAAEGTTGDQLYDTLGNAIFKRAPLAGLPFVDSAEEQPVCTPALLNGAAGPGAPAAAATTVALLLTLAGAAAH